MVEVPKTVKKPLPCVQFTILSLMMAVALVGTVLGLIIERRSRFLRLAEHHRLQIVGVLSGNGMGRDRICRYVWLDAQGKPLSHEQIENDRWHRELSLKYLLAVRQLRLPVEPDPPEP